MSLTRLVDLQEVKEKLKPLRPLTPRKLSIKLLCESKSNRYMLVGTAFDYLLRFELQRRNPHAISERWIAEQSLHRIYHKGEKTHAWLGVLPGEGGDVTYRRIQKILDSARNALCSASIIELAKHAIRLAKLDSLGRGSTLDPTFESAEEEDAQDLLEMLAIVPFDQFPTQPLLLNPSFGEVSRMVGGADADLIAGNALIDVKTTKKGEIEATALDQLLGYLFLARRHRTANQAFPLIDRLGIYLSRHGHLWSMPASTWTSHPAFAETEAWFFQKAAATFPRTNPNNA